MLLVLIFALLSLYGLTREGRERFHRESNLVYARRALKFIQYLIPKDVVGKNLVRVGSFHDGGYTMLDDFSNTKKAYSLGVGRRMSWEKDLASRGLNVFMFDPTIASPNLNNTLLKFYKIGIADRDIPKKNLTNLENLLKLDNNLKEENMILKLDVEGAEWESLFQINSSTLERFSQIVIEFHWLEKVLVSERRFKIGLADLQKLNRTHELVWVHGTNCHYKGDIYSFGRVPFPNVFEVCYVRRIGHQFENRRSRGRVDERCDKQYGEVLLWWLEGEGAVDVSDLLDYYEKLKKGKYEE